jgi:hypothetical protein
MKRAPVIFTLVLTALTLMVLVLSVPESLRDDFQRHNLYLFSLSFIREIPQRMSGPGRFRLILQPILAGFLGIKGGRADVRLGRPPYLSSLLFHRGLRRELLRHTFLTLVNLLLMSILLDSLFQWLIYGISHPGPALNVGPTLIGAPYALSRELANRVIRLRARRAMGDTPEGSTGLTER